jgi:hypothetical protein
LEGLVGRRAEGEEIEQLLSRALVEDGFRRRSAGLPAKTQLLLLVAAADPTGEAALLWRATTHLGIAREAVAPAEQAGLVEMGARVRFRHPLVRSAVYRAAAPPDRRRAHGALAVSTDSHDPDRRAWHRAQSVLGADEDAAAELTRSTDRARARGGLAAAAAFLATRGGAQPGPFRPCSPSTGSRPRQARRRGVRGSPRAADGGGGRAAGCHATPRVELLRARTAFRLTRGTEVPGMLLAAANTLAALDAA